MKKGAQEAHRSILPSMRSPLQLRIRKVTTDFNYEPRSNPCHLDSCSSSRSSVLVVQATRLPPAGVGLLCFEVPPWAWRGMRERER